MSIDTKAITQMAVAIVTAIIGVIVAAGLPLSHQLTAAIITLVTVITPVTIVVIGWLHHSKIVLTAAAVKASTGSAKTPAQIAREARTAFKE